MTCVAYGGLPAYISWIQESNQTTLDNSSNSWVTVYEELVTEGELTFTQSILEICSVEEMDESNYTCVAVNSFGNDTATFELSVNPEGSVLLIISYMAQNKTYNDSHFAVFDTMILIGPEDVTVEAGSTVFITCVAYSEDVPSITWIQNDDQTIMDEFTSTRVIVHEELLMERGLTFVQSILEVCSVEVSDSGNYSCVASNGFRNASASFDLTVLPVGGKKHHHHSVSCEIVFTISTLLVLPDPAQIIVAPRSLTVDAGVTVLMTCVAYGGLPAYISWIQESNQTTLDNSSNSWVTVYEELVTEGELTFTQSILEICSVEEMDESNYTCVAENSFGNDTATFELSVNPEGSVLLIISYMAQNKTYNDSHFAVFDTTILIGPEDVTMEAGSTVFITCVAYSKDIPSITWIINDDQTVMDEFNSTRIIVHEELLMEGGLTFVQSILEVCSVEVSDSGKYNCLASNGYRNESTSFDLTVQPVVGKKHTPFTCHISK